MFTLTSLELLLLTQQNKSLMQSVPDTSFLVKVLAPRLTVDLELRGCSRGTVNDELMRGVATMFARSHNFGSSSWIHILNNMPIDNEFES